MYIGTVGIVPSRSDIQYDKIQNAYTCSTLVINTSNTNVNMLVIGQLEILNGHKSVRINPSSYSILKDLVKQFPLGREILPTIPNQLSSVPIFSVTKTKLKDAENFDVNENQADALYSQSPSYMGEAEINSTTFKPKGIVIAKQRNKVCL